MYSCGPSAMEGPFAPSPVASRSAVAPLRRPDFTLRAPGPSGPSGPKRKGSEGGRTGVGEGAQQIDKKNESENFDSIKIF